jgi:hypothetical protein
MGEWLLRAVRVVVNALIGAFAGAVPPVAWLAWVEMTTGFRNGLGGVAWLAALVAATLMGGLGGAVVGATGRGLRVIRLGSTSQVLFGACGGSAIGSAAGYLAVGLGDQESVVVVLVAGTASIVLGMVVLTSPRVTSPSPEHP